MLSLWIALLLIPIWVYGGYPLALWLWRRLRPRRAPDLRAEGPLVWPRVTLLIAARDEETEIAGRIQNALDLDYPHDRLEIVVASDASTDRTDEIVRSFAEERVRLVRGTGAGKSAAQNAALPHIRGEILVLSDANNRYHRGALRELLAPLSDPLVGGTVGRARYLNEASSPVTRGEGIYWRYELCLRGLESDAGILAMGSGPIMALRREFAQGWDRDESDDFALPLRVVAAGRRVVYVPTAISEEILYQDRARPMYRSRVRIVSKDLRTLLRHVPALIRAGRFSALAGLVSHKLLRWSLGALLPPLLLLSLILAARFPGVAILLALQIVAYALAVWGAAARNRRSMPCLPAAAFHFCLNHAAALHGILRAGTGRRSGSWRPERHARGMAALDKMQLEGCPPMGDPFPPSKGEAQS